MIKLIKLELENFLSHINTTIDFNDYEGLVLIEGVTTDSHYSSNGAGKSTLLEGIVYALTGDTLRGVSVNDVVNRNVKKDTKVSLTFDKEGVLYTISRYRKHTIYGDSLSIVEGDKDISKRTTKDTQKLLEDILGISYKILISTVLLGEGLSSKFTQLSDPEKKSLIESTLSLDYDMNKLRDKSNEKLKSLRLEESKLLGEMNILYSLASTDIEHLRDSLRDNEQCVSIYEKTIKELETSLPTLEAEVSAIQPKLDLLKQSILRHETISQQYMELVSSNEKYQTERDNVSNNATHICNLCRQALQSEESKQSVINSYTQAIKDNLEKMAVIESELEKIPEKAILQDKYETLSKESVDKYTQLQSMRTDLNNYKIKLAQTLKDIESAKSTIASMEDTQSQLSSKENEKSRVSSEISKYEYFYQLFSPTGIIVNILTEAIEYINSRLSVYSEVLLEKEYRLHFLKGKISLVDNKGSSYQSLSNGEKRRLDISIQFALHDYVHMYCGLKLDCCYIDEILDTLDDIGVDNIFDVLRLKLDYCHLKSIYVITHNNSLKSKFDRVITIEKRSDGNSYIV